MFIRIIYTFFLALLIALFVGFGIDTFYPEPKYPEMPVILEMPMKGDPDSTQTAEQTKAWEEWRETEKDFREEIGVYNRNVSGISLVAALIVLIAALTLLRQIQMVSDGILLGGVFILIYSMGRSFGSGSSKYVFLVASIELVVAIMLGYLIFVKPKQEEELAMAKKAVKKPAPRAKKASPKKRSS